MDRIEFISAGGRYYINGIEVDSQKYETVRNEFYSNVVEFANKYAESNKLEKELVLDKYIRNKESYEDETAYHFVLELKRTKDKPGAEYDSEKKILSLDMESETINFHVEKKVKGNARLGKSTFLNNILDISLVKEGKRERGRWL